MIEKAGELIEQNLELAGATAIEDKLQKGVPEAIDKLRRANIKMWMLTGDKRETAINIGHSCRLIKDYSSVTVLDHETGEVEQHIAAAILAINEGNVAHSVVVVDGQTLAMIEADKSIRALLFELAIIADSVICCRASPSQKAGLVKAIRKRVNHAITLAIGDGANDIAMIQEAHVGIGITGKEGLQAARTSDYSIAQFRFLTKLLLVHGRWNYVRTCKYTVGTFWKEMVRSCNFPVVMLVAKRCAVLLPRTSLIPALGRLHRNQSLRVLESQHVQHRKYSISPPIPVNPTLMTTPALHLSPCNLHGCLRKRSGRLNPHRRA